MFRSAWGLAATFGDLALIELGTTLERALTAVRHAVNAGPRYETTVAANADSDKDRSNCNYQLLKQELG